MNSNPRNIGRVPRINQNRPRAIAVDLVLGAESERRRNRPGGPNGNDPLKYLGWVIAFVTVLWLLCQTVFAQSNTPKLRIDGEDWNKSSRVSVSNELAIESPYNIKRIKILRKVFNDYKLESYVDIKPASKNVGMILAVSANKVASGDFIQLMLIPENESLKLSDSEQSFYIHIE